jgi:hypothetical protein
MMTRSSAGAAMFLTSAFFAASAQAQTADVPEGVDTLAGTGGYSTVYHSAARSYQIVMNESVVQAAGIAPNSNITGLAFRRPTWSVHAPWPTNAVTFAAWDLTLSRSNNPAPNLSTTYTDNIGADAVLVRSGPLTMQPAALPGGALTPAVNPWGETIAFTTPYLYTGGDLLITIRHTGNGVTSGAVETPPTALVAGCQAKGVSSYTQADTWYAQGMLSLLITFEAGTTCGSADFDGDGDTGTDADIEAFFACLGGNCCPTCGTADFDGDGDVGTDADIEAFFRVLGGGAC